MDNKSQAVLIINRSQPSWFKLRKTECFFTGIKITIKDAVSQKAQKQRCHIHNTLNNNP